MQASPTYSAVKRPGDPTLTWSAAIGVYSPRLEGQLRAFVLGSPTPVSALAYRPLALGGYTPTHWVDFTQYLKQELGLYLLDYYY